MNGHFDIGAIKPFRYFSFIALVLGLLFGFITPIENEQSRIIVIIQWLLQTCLPMLFLVSCHIVLSKIPHFNHLLPLTRIIVSGVIASLIFAPIALYIDILFQQESDEPLSEALMNEWFASAPPVVICWIAINAPWLLGYGFNETKQPIEKNSLPSDDIDDPGKVFKAEAPTTLDKSFWDLVKKDIGSDLIYLKAELHYLQVVTSKGKDLILYNLRDAASEIPADQGDLCHRSYWVAFKHVKQLSKQGRQGTLTTDNGENIPVSRSRMNRFTDQIKI